MISRFKLQTSDLTLHTSPNLHPSDFILQTSEAGLTLVELIVSMVIIAILGLSLMSVFSGWGKSTVQNNYKMALQRELDHTIERIRLVLQEANGATVSSEGATNNKLTITTGGSTDIFRSNVASGELLHGGVNMIQDYMNAGIKVDSLTFTKTTTADLKQLITTTLSLKYVDYGGNDYSVEFRTTTLLRNS